MRRLQWVISQNLCRKLAHFSVYHAGKIRCEIAGSKKYSSDLVQDGLEIPAKKIFPNSKERINAEMKKKFAPLIEEFNKNIKCYKYM